MSVDLFAFTGKVKADHLALGLNGFDESAGDTYERLHKLIYKIEWGGALGWKKGDSVCSNESMLTCMASWNVKADASIKNACVPMQLLTVNASKSRH